MKNFNENSFLNDINDSYVFGNIGSYSEAQQAWLVWKNEFLKICNKDAPIRLSTVKNTCSPWITNEILDSIYYINYLHKKAIKSKKLEDFTCYRKAKNSIALKIKKEKKSFYAKIFSTSNSSHKFWNTVKTIIPNKNKHFVNQNLTATKFNKYFSSIGTNIPMILTTLIQLLIIVKQTLNLYSMTYPLLLSSNVCPVSVAVLLWIFLKWIQNC